MDHAVPPPEELDENEDTGGGQSSLYSSPSASTRPPTSNALRSVLWTDPYQTARPPGFRDTYTTSYPEPAALPTLLNAPLLPANLSLPIRNGNNNNNNHNNNNGNSSSPNINPPACSAITGQILSPAPLRPIPADFPSNLVVTELHNGSNIFLDMANTFPPVDSAAAMPIPIRGQRPRLASTRESAATENVIRCCPRCSSRVATPASVRSAWGLSSIPICLCPQPWAAGPAAGLGVEGGMSYSDNSQLGSYGNGNGNGNGNGSGSGIWGSRYQGYQGYHGDYSIPADPLTPHTQTGTPMSRSSNNTAFSFNDLDLDAVYNLFSQPGGADGTQTTTQSGLHDMNMDLSSAVPMDWTAAGPEPDTDSDSAAGPRGGGMFTTATSMDVDNDDVPAQVRSMVPGGGAWDMCTSTNTNTGAGTGTAGMDLNWDVNTGLTMHHHQMPSQHAMAPDPAAGFGPLLLGGTTTFPTAGSDQQVPLPAPAPAPFSIPLSAPFIPRHDSRSGSSSGLVALAAAASNAATASVTSSPAPDHQRPPPPTAATAAIPAAAAVSPATAAVLPDPTTASSPLPRAPSSPRNSPPPPPTTTTTSAANLPTPSPSATDKSVDSGRGTDGKEAKAETNEQAKAAAANTTTTTTTTTRKKTKTKPTKTKTPPPPPPPPPPPTGEQSDDAHSSTPERPGRRARRARQGKRRRASSGK